MCTSTRIPQKEDRIVTGIEQTAKLHKFAPAFSSRTPAAALDTGTLVSALYNECAGEDGVSLSSFCHLVAHQRLLSWDFDHLSSLKTFRQQTGIPQQAEDQHLDKKVFEVVARYDGYALAKISKKIRPLTTVNEVG
eukprot:Skav235581  [mRNA]  locus=scaffold612:167973:172050:- [translate_table: standard]